MAGRLSSDDIGRGETAFAEAKAKNWLRVRQIRRGIGDPTLRKLLAWIDLIRSDANVSFEDRARFIQENPDWPWLRRLRRLAEKSMRADIPPIAVISWFDRFEPLTNQGRQRLGAAFLATGDQNRGRRVIQDAWIEGDFSARQEGTFFQRYGDSLTQDVHLPRLDRLLWDGDHDQARRMFPRVGVRVRLSGEARIQLRRMTPLAEQALARVPQDQLGDPGLVYERVRWERRKELDERARDTLRLHPLDSTHPKLWWRERSILARRALEDGYVSEAYRTAISHALTEGAEFADAEWLSGWIALRFLEEPKQAAYHFERMFNAVRYPISRARGAYWMGRAAEFSGDRPTAARWYGTAALHPTTFYGQLATLRREGAAPLSLPPDPAPTPEEVAAFQNHELVRAISILATFDQTNRLRPFLFRVGELVDSPGWKAQAAALANARGQDDLAIAISKMAVKDGSILTRDGYPLIDILRSPTRTPQAVEKALVLAMIRQESAFRTGAVSPAGARGLMQLLPGTARQVARKVNVSYSKPRLTSDPGYNLKLGQAYMSDMLQRFGSSYVLALAAYNAGPLRVAKWTQSRGYPRDSLAVAIDWIEQIPFSETRNYVQRIVESLQVYRLRLDRSGAGTTIEDDLTR